MRRGRIKEPSTFGGVFEKLQRFLFLSLAALPNFATSATWPSKRWNHTAEASFGNQPLNDSPESLFVSAVRILHHCFQSQEHKSYPKSLSA